jgi:multidrug efflux pump subunit AcrB
MGTAIERTEDVTSSFENFISKELTVDSVTNVSSEKESVSHEGVTSWISYIGSGGTRFVLSHNPAPPGSNYALLVLNTTSSEVIDELIVRLNRYAFDHFPDVLINAKRISSAAAVKNPVEVRLYGNDADTLFHIMEETKAEMNGGSALKNWW